MWFVWGEVGSNKWLTYPFPDCLGQRRGSSGDVVHQVQALGDVEILKSYLLLVWSEWDYIDNQQSGGLTKMLITLREDFSGIWMWCHQQDLIEWLDHILGQLDRGLNHLQ